MTTKAPEDLLKRIRQGTRFLVTSHTSPDGDAIGSELGLARTLRSLGKSVVVWNRDGTPSLYTPLPGSSRIHIGEEAPSGFPDSYDAVIVLECPSLDRTGLEEHLAEQPILNIDHHLGNQHYGAINWVDSSAPAVGEMIYRLAQGLLVSVDQETATALYLTLVTDTGGFRFSNATPAAFEAAAALVKEGAQPQLVTEWLYEQQPEATLRLLGEMLRTLELHQDGRVATVLLTPGMYKRAGAAPGDSEGLIDYPRSIAGVQAVALLRQLKKDRFKVSLRSRGAVDVERVARHYGGGGHHNAAGFEIDGAEDRVRGEVVAALLKNLDPEA
jgi:phosphoesterase RecJ-like protein